MSYIVAVHGSVYYCNRSEIYVYERENFAYVSFPDTSTQVLHSKVYTYF